MNAGKLCTTAIQLKEILAAKTLKDLRALGSELRLPNPTKLPKDQLINDLIYTLADHYRSSLKQLPGSSLTTLRSLVEIGGALIHMEPQPRFYPLMANYLVWQRLGLPETNLATPPGDSRYQRLLRAGGPDRLITVVPREVVALLGNPTGTSVTEEPTLLHRAETPDLIEIVVVLYGLALNEGLHLAKDRSLTKQSLKDVMSLLGANLQTWNASYQAVVRARPWNLKTASSQITFAQGLAQSAGLMVSQGSRLIASFTGWSWLAANRRDQLAFLTPAWAVGIKNPSYNQALSYLQDEPNLDSSTVVSQAYQAIMERLSFQWQPLSTVTIPVMTQSATIESKALTKFVTGPLFWLGQVALARGSANELLCRKLPPVAENSQSADNPRAEPCQLHDSTIVVKASSSRLQLARLTLLGEWRAGPDRGEYTITLDREKVTKLADSGTPSPMMVTWVTDACQALPDAELINCIHEWGNQKRRPRLDRIIILETNRPQELSRIRSQPRLRSHLVQPLSRTMAVVGSRRIESLIKTLNGMGLPPSVKLAPKEIQPPPLISRRLKRLVYAELCRLLMTVTPLPVPVTIPSSFYQRLPVRDVQWARIKAGQVLAPLLWAINGHIPFPPRNPFGAATRIRRLVKRAIATGAGLTITYQAAGHAIPTPRTITPYCLETRKTIEYVQAFCHLRNEDRLFRLDRIATAKLTDSSPMYANKPKSRQPDNEEGSVDNR